MDTIDYGALFGVDVGAEEQEVAEPANDQAEDVQGAEEQEVAEPDVETEPQTTGAEEPASETDTGTVEGKEKPKQTKEERAQFAAARRKAEAERDAMIAKARDEAYAQAQEEAKKWLDEAISNTGLTNPYTKQPIKSKAEYDEYRARFDSERAAQVQQKSGLSDAEFTAFVNNLPQVKAALQAQEAAKQAEQKVREQEAKNRLDEEIREIHELDPSINEPKDLFAMPNYQQFYDLVKAGNNFVNAFKLANFEKLTMHTAAQARQAAANAARSKDHLSRTTTRGAGAVSVPNDVKEAYLAFNPNATEAEIQKHYNQYIKK